MNSIALAIPRIVTELKSPAHLAPFLHRLAAWYRFRNYPSSRAARGEAVFAWLAAYWRNLR